jgi:PIN domain nuclease of toxin-antitoxin system
MKPILLDTCAFVWLASKPAHLSPAAIEILQDTARQRTLSQASVWEIVLKFRTGKLPLPHPPRIWIEEQARLQHIHIHTLEREVLYRSGELPDIHKDPFDRLIAAEALYRKMPLLSPDAPFLAYGCKVVW